MSGFIARSTDLNSGSYPRPFFDTHAGARESAGGDSASKNGGEESPSRTEDRLMRTTPRFTITWLLLVASLLSTCTGCLIPMYSGDPVRRARQLIHTSEDLRAITDEWERIWFLDQPSHMKPYRTHGGIL